MTTLAGWVIAPIVLLLMSGAVGLLAERVARAELPDGLLVPLGAWTLVVVLLPVYLLDLSAPFAAAVGLVLAAGGIWVGRRALLRPVRTPAAVAGVLGYLLYLAPVLLTGHWTWSGYNFVNDPSVNWVIVDHLMSAGDAKTSAPASTATQVINGTLGVSYPLGIHGLLATVNWLVPVALPALYQPFIAFLGGISAMAFATLARASKLPWWAAVTVALAAIGAGLTYNYALHGAFKEVAVVGCLATAAALGRVALDVRLKPGPVGLMAIALAASIAIISSVAGAYALALAGLLVLAALGLERRERLSARVVATAAVVGTVVLVVAISPFLRELIAFGRTASDQFGSATGDSTSVLGHLVRPLPLYQALGPWLRDDYRYPLEPGTSYEWLTVVLLIVAGALVALGVFVELRSRRWAALLVFAPALAVALATEPRLSAYGHAKLLVILAPMAVFTAAIGAWWLIGKVRVVGILAGLALVGGVAFTDALAYRYTSLAPPDRMVALQDAVDHAGDGRWLSLEWEEYAKYFGRDIRLNVGPESYSPEPVRLRVDEPIFHRTFDTDQLTLEYVQEWDGLLLRRGPELSRPPVNFTRVYRNAYYELWRKDADLPRPVEHLPLGTDQRQGARTSCLALEGLAGDAGRRDRLVAAPAPPQPDLDPRDDRPRGWGPIAGMPDVLIPKGQGLVERPVAFLRGGGYRVWVRGGSERPLTVTVDGHAVGSARGANTPGSWLEIGTADVPAGRHQVTLERPGGSLRPGDRNSGVVGRVVFEPLAPEATVSVPVAEAKTLCAAGNRWDWIELIPAG